MKTAHTRYRIFKIIDDAEMHHSGSVGTATLQNCTHIEFEAREDAEEWLTENGDHRSQAHEYVILPCIRIVQDNS